MAFIDAISALNDFKRRQVIRDYAIIGAVAATAYIEPMFTADLDVIVRVKSDEEYLQVFGRIAEHSESLEGMHQVLGGVPVQMFPSNIMPLYRDAIEHAREVRVGNVRTKVATAEHLILLGLLANREQDHIRIRRILRHTDSERLSELLERFDDGEKNLATRLQNLRGTSVPREGEMAPSTGTDEF